MSPAPTQLHSHFPMIVVWFPLCPPIMKHFGLIPFSLLPVTFVSWLSHGRGRRSGGGKRGGGVLLSGRLLQRPVFQCNLGPVKIMRCPWLRAQSESDRLTLPRLLQGVTFLVHLAYIIWPDPVFTVPKNWKQGMGFQIRLNRALSSFLKALLWLWFCTVYLLRREGNSSVHQAEFLAISISD